MVSLGKCFLNPVPLDGQNKGFYIDPFTLEKLQACDMLIPFFWDMGCPQKEREHLKTLSLQDQLAFIQSGMKTRDGVVWNGCPLYLNDRWQEKWYWLVPELNSHRLEGIKEWVDKRYPHPCFRNAKDTIMFPRSYGPKL